MLNNTIPNLPEDKSLGIKEQIFKYLRHWKWFLLSTFFFLFLSKIYLRYSIPEYKSQTTLLIKREDSGGMSSELAAFQDLSMFSGAKRDLDDEIEVLKSR